jgi:hypothetical protein
LKNKEKRKYNMFAISLRSRKENKKKISKNPTWLRKSKIKKAFTLNSQRPCYNI